MGSKWDGWWVVPVFFFAACGGRVVVDHTGPGGGNGGFGGFGGFGGMGGFPDTSSGFPTSTGDVNPIGSVTGTGGSSVTFTTSTTSTETFTTPSTFTSTDFTTITTTTTTTNCMSFSCSGGSNFCSCDGQCDNGSTARVVCNHNGCNCFEGGGFVGHCNQPGPLDCTFPGSCCDGFF